MAKSLTDVDSAVISMNKAMAKVTEQMGRLAVSAGMAHTALDTDITQQFQHFFYFMEALERSLPFRTGRHHGGDQGFGKFYGMERGVLQEGIGPSYDYSHTIDNTITSNSGNTSNTYPNNKPGEVKLSYDPNKLLTYTPVGPVQSSTEKSAWYHYKGKKAASYEPEEKNLFNPLGSVTPLERLINRILVPITFGIKMGGMAAAQGVAAAHGMGRPDLASTMSIITGGIGGSIALVTSYISKVIDRKFHVNNKIWEAKTSIINFGLKKLGLAPLSNQPKERGKYPPIKDVLHEFISDTIKSPIGLVKEIYSLISKKPGKIIEGYKERFLHTFGLINRLGGVFGKDRNLLYDKDSKVETVLQNAGGHVKSFFQDVFADQSLIERPQYRHSNARHFAIPPSMRMKKFSGMGGPTDAFSHRGAEVAANYLTQEVVRKGDHNLLPQVAVFQAHLQGSRQMDKDELHLFIKNLKEHNTEVKTGRNTTRLEKTFTADFMEKVLRAYRMAEDKHEASQAHVDRLRKKGLLRDDGTSATSAGSDKNVAERAERGKTAKSIREFAVRAMRGESEGAKQFARSSFQYSGMAISSASPDIFATLTGSFKLLAATIGTELLPYAVTGSRVLQGLAKSFEQASGKTKGILSATAAFSAFAGVAFLVTPQLVALAKILAAMGGKKLLSGMWGLAATSPATSLGLGLGAAGAVKIWHSVSDIENRRRELDLETSQKAAANTPDKLKENALYKQVAPLYATGKKADAEKANEIIQTQFKANSNKVTLYMERIKSYEGEQRKKGWSHPINSYMDLMDYTYNHLFKSDKIKAEHEKLHGSKVKLQEDTDAATAARLGFKKYEEIKKGDPRYGKLRDAQIARVAPLLQQYINRVQPAYYGVEDMYKRIQLSALQETPLDAELKRIWLQNLEKEAKGVEWLEAIYNTLAGNPGMAP